MIWSVILAAGESRRMGAPKMLLPFRGRTVIETVVRTAAASRTDGTLVVVGARGPEIARSLDLCAVRIVRNPAFRDGMLSSVQAAVRALPPEAEAAVIMLGDQPSIPAAVVDRLIAARAAGRAGIVLPAFRGRRGHPVLIDLKHRSEILALPPGSGLRDLVRAHPDDVLEVPVRTSAVLRDMDLPEDYRRERRSRRGA